MTLKIFAAILLLATFKWLYSSFLKPKEVPETPIDQAWWDGLSEEWQTILRINQYFKQQEVDFYQVQNDYLNRLNGSEDADYTELNTSLRLLNEKKTFLLSYSDLYARVRKRLGVSASDSIDLGSLHELDRLYMVSGPGDLTPLKKLPNLKVLVANYCGIKHGTPFSEQVLDLEPLRQLKQLEHLHCVSPALKSVEPLKGLTNLVYLNCDNSHVTSLAPLKNLRNLEHLSFGSTVENAAVVARLSNLKTLHITGCKQIPDLSGLKKLKALSIVENELAIVNRNYRMTHIDFLKNLSALEFLDIELTSYRGTLDNLKNLTQLKAITLSRVSTLEVLAFKQNHPDCAIINAYEFE